ncbi:hypothetical protein Lesp01_77890 [Lentzea sp. NBRC 102530]|nr:hypothetical protein Lesp01_77890 [Lentzea sp. NBRC 102530]
MAGWLRSIDSLSKGVIGPKAKTAAPRRITTAATNAPRVTQRLYTALEYP